MDELDPVEELHEIRRRLIEKAGGTLDAYVRHVMERQQRNPAGLVDLSKPRTARRKASRKPAQAATA